MDKNKALLLDAVRALGSDAYGGAIQEKLEEWGHHHLSLGAIYVGLEILEREGILRSRMAPGGPERNGRPKLCYELVKSDVT